MHKQHKKTRRVKKMNNMLNLEPKLVWKYFDEITKVPRPSKKEEKIIKYLLDFAEKNKLEAEEDEVGNIIIRKAATEGKENTPSVVLQSHMDMVCEKNNDVDFNFETEAINVYIDGDWLKAKGTTLGADDGIGMAISQAVLLDENLSHGPLECLFTVDEESGMTGAFGLQKGFVKSNILINLDSEDEGEIYIGCAGGIDTVATFSFKTKKVPNGYYSCKISVKGLKGGHSGDDISKGLGNSNKILNRFLWNITKKTDLRLSNFDGGNLRNAIAREAHAIICVPFDYKEKLRIELNKYTADVTNELFVTEPNIILELETADTPEYVINRKAQKQLLDSIYACPHGVFAWSQDIENLVETSTNLASVKFKETTIELVTSQRSSLESAKENIASMVATVLKLAGAKVEHSDGYPGWQPKMDSKILKVSKESYEKLFNKTPEIKAVHAGLECGLFLTKYPNMDMISIGPTVRGAHSPDERIEISSVPKFWDLLITILADLRSSTYL